MPHQWREVRRRRGAGGNFFLAWGDLGETLLIFGSCGRGWAEGRLCSGREQKELGKRGAPSISERIESQRGSSTGCDSDFISTLGHIV